MLIPFKRSMFLNKKALLLLPAISIALVLSAQNTPADSSKLHEERDSNLVLSARNTPLDRIHVPTQVITKYVLPSNLEITTQAMYYSSKVPAGALYRVQGGKLNNNMIGKTADRIGSGVASIQGENSIQVCFNDHAHSVFPSKTGYWSLDYKYTNLVGASFNQDAFNLVFRGNAPFAGTTMRSENLSLNSMSWNQLGASFTKQIKSASNNNYWFEAGVAWVFMREYTRLSMPRAHLFTSGLGDSLNLSYQLDLTSKDKNTLGFYPLSHGASVNVQFGGMKAKNGHSHYWRVSVSDLGLVSLGSAGATYAKDSSLGINGWQVPFTPYGIDSNASFSNYFDTLLNRMNPRRSGLNSLVPLPALLSFSKGVYLSNGRHVFGNLVYRAYPGFIPRVSVGYGKYLGLFYFGSQLSYGGVNAFDLRTFAACTIKNLRVRLDINSVEGLLFPGKLGGAGAALLLVWDL